MTTGGPSLARATEPPPLEQVIRSNAFPRARRCICRFSGKHRRFSKRPWTGDGLGSSWWKLVQLAGLKEKGLRFHDFRGTAATRLYLCDFRLREIAEVLGWSEERVEKIINRYVKRDEILRDRIRRIEQGRKGPDGRPKDVARNSG